MFRVESHDMWDEYVERLILITLALSIVLLGP